MKNDIMFSTSPAEKPRKASYNTNKIFQIQKGVNAKINDWIAFESSKRRPKEVTFDNYDEFCNKKEVDDASNSFKHTISTGI